MSVNPPAGRAVSDRPETDAPVVDRREPGTGEAAADDVADRLAAVLGRLVRLLRRQVPVEIGPGSLAALGTLSRCGPMRLGDLAAREGVAPPTLTRMVATLEEAGYIVRRADPHDRRAVQVSITAEGLRTVVESRASRAAALIARMAALPDADRAALRAALPALEALSDDTE
jgi:DNA-binding MarR family transcriptional regulator